MLACLRENYQAAADDYEKLEQALPVERLAPLEESFCPMEPVAMLQAALVIVYFYQQLAPPLAQAHGIPYPADLELVVSDQLEQACHVNIN